jgi:hypothetical protein
MNNWTRNNEQPAGPIAEPQLAVILLGERVLRRMPRVVTEPSLLELAAELITVYDSPFGRTDLKWRAADIVTGLAITSSAIVDLVIKNASQYAGSQHIDDAFPYSPNGFDVLVQIGRRDGVIPFLRRVARDDWGVARSSAVTALSELGISPIGEVRQFHVDGREDLVSAPDCSDSQQLLSGDCRSSN